MLGGGGVQRSCARPGRTLPHIARKTLVTRKSGVRIFPPCPKRNILLPSSQILAAVYYQLLRLYNLAIFCFSFQSSKCISRNDYASLSGGNAITSGTAHNSRDL